MARPKRRGTDTKKKNNVRDPVFLGAGEKLAWEAVDGGGALEWGENPDVNGDIGGRPTKKGYNRDRGERN